MPQDGENEFFLTHSKKFASHGIVPKYDCQLISNSYYVAFEIPVHFQWYLSAQHVTPIVT